ncbi:MAG: hypothetical protein AB8B91_20830 [Rubripirellula sp.]
MNVRYSLGIVGAVLCATVTLANDGDSSLVDGAFREPTERDVERYRDMLSSLDLEHAALDRFAFQCRGVILNDKRPERFVSLHAVDREMDAVRHVVKRSFTDDILLATSEGVTTGGGYGDSRNPAFFPVGFDRLRIGPNVFLSNKLAEAQKQEDIKFTGEDRNFNPVTCSTLPYTNFFRGRMGKMPLGQAFMIENLTPDLVRSSRSRFVVKNRLLTTDRIYTGFYGFLQFENELPTAHECWLIVADRRELKFRTTTKWKSIKGMNFPIHMEAVHKTVLDKTVVFEVDIEWRFNEDVDQRLFEVADVKSPTALDW